MLTSYETILSAINHNILTEFKLSDLYESPKNLTFRNPYVAALIGKENISYEERQLRRGIYSPHSSVMNNWKHSIGILPKGEIAVIRADNMASTCIQILDQNTLAIIAELSKKSSFTDEWETYTSLAILEDGTLVTCGSQGTLTYWDPYTHEVSHQAYAPGVKSIIALPGNRLLCVSDKMLTIKHGNNVIVSLPQKEQDIVDICLLPENILAVAHKTNITLWNLINCQTINRLDNPVDTSFRHVVCDANGNLISADDNGEVRFWPKFTSSTNFTFPVKYHDIGGLLVFENHLVVAASKQLDLWYLNTRQLLQTQILNAEFIRYLCMSKDNRLFFASLKSDTNVGYYGGEINFSYWPINLKQPTTTQIINLIYALVNNTSIKNLSLSNLNKEMFKALIELITNSKTIECLDLSANVFDEKEVEEIITTLNKNLFLQQLKFPVDNINPLLNKKITTLLDRNKETSFKTNNKPNLPLNDAAKRLSQQQTSSCTRKSFFFAATAVACAIAAFAISHADEVKDSFGLK